jgi:hypothetical protein
MRGLSVLLKQLTVAMIATVSLVNWTVPHSYTGNSAAHHDAGPGLRGTEPCTLDSTSHSMQADAAQRARIQDQYENLPLSFEINRGQADQQVRFISRNDGYDLSISPTEALLIFTNSSPALACASSPPSILRMTLLGANSNAPAVGLEQLHCKTNYFIGNDPKAWRADVPAYSKVKCRDVYPGVDLVYYGTKGQLEYDFIVSAGSSYQSITMRFEGADNVSLNKEGDVVIGTATGEFHHRRPVAYQENNGLKSVVAARYSLRNSGEVGFEIGAYDAEQPLIIDPVLSYSTYFGSRSGADSLTAVAFDAAGNIYAVGSTSSADLPTTPGALQPGAPQPGSGFGDAFVTKLNPSGTAVLYTTYLGGSGVDDAAAIAVDAAGTAYVTGSTSSNDFPTTANAFQRGSLGVSSHPFIAKLSPTGAALAYATYLGTKNEIASAFGIAVDEAGQATIAGYTDSSSFPTTPGALQRTSAGNYDAFLARLNPDGSALVYSTYLGGEGYDSVNCLALDTSGNAYVAGRTLSTDFPTTRQAYQRERKGPEAIFVAKVSATGDRLAYSTLLSGGDYQIVDGIAVDLSGNAYVTGSTQSVKLPTTPGSLQTAPAGGYDAFVTKLNDAGSDLVYSTFIGGAGTDFATAIAVDSLGQVYVTGGTTSINFPLMRPLQSRKLGGPLFRTSDGGSHWRDVPDLGFELSSLVVDPQVSSTLYGSTFTEIITSTDSGETWRTMLPGQSGSVVPDPVRPGILYILSGRTILRSTDAGATWQRTEFPLDMFASIRTLVIDPIRPDILYLGVRRPTVLPNAVPIKLLDEPLHNSVFKSTDAGASWTPTDFGMPVFSISDLAIDPQMTSTVYAVTDTQGALKSTNGGANWFRIGNAGLFASRLIVDPTNSATLYANGPIGILKSTDGGASWVLIPPQHFPLTSLAMDPQTPSTLYAGNQDGLFQTTDGGASWRVRLDRVFVKAIALDPRQPSNIYLPAAVTTDVFVAKLNATGTALVYSTYLGGTVTDSASGIAADAYGNAYVGGTTYSSNFPVTPNAYQPRGVLGQTGFVLRIADPTLPRIAGCTINGKKLLVSGGGFDRGAVITVDNTDLQTQNDAATPSVLLISKRGGKQIGRGQTVTIRVRNMDGTLSNEFAFTRSLD